MIKVFSCEQEQVVRINDFPSPDCSQDNIYAQLEKDLTGDEYDIVMDLPFEGQLIEDSDTEGAIEVDMTWSEYIQSLKDFCVEF